MILPVFCVVGLTCITKVKVDYKGKLHQKVSNLTILQVLRNFPNRNKLFLWPFFLLLYMLIIQWWQHQALEESYMITVSYKYTFMMAIQKKLVLRLLVTADYTKNWCPIEIPPLLHIESWDHLFFTPNGLFLSLACDLLTALFLSFFSNSKFSLFKFPQFYVYVAIFQGQEYEGPNAYWYGTNI